MDSTINRSASVQDNAAHTTRPEGSEAAGSGTAASPQPQKDPQHRICRPQKSAAVWFGSAVPLTM